MGQLGLRRINRLLGWIQSWLLWNYMSFLLLRVLLLPENGEGVLMGIGRGSRVNSWLLQPVVLLKICQNFGLFMMRQLSTERRHGMAMVCERVL
jgi:hypothetical protein